MTLWSFNVTTGWHEIDDFLQTPETSDCAEERKLAGFSSVASLAIGDTEGTSFCVEVYNRAHSPATVKEPQYEFLTCIDIGGAIYFVAIPKLPDLLEFLRQTVPLSISIEEWAIKKEKYIKEIEKQFGGVTSGKK